MYSTKPTGKQEWLYVSDQTCQNVPQIKSEPNAAEGADPNPSVSKSELEEDLHSNESRINGHEKQEITDKSDQSFVCKICSEKFAVKSELIVHVRFCSRTHLKKVYQCEYCPRTFSKKVVFDQHTRTHTGEKPFPCTICPKRLATKVSLDFHLKTHEENRERPLACHICNKTFHTKSSLTNHLDTHSSDKLYQVGPLTQMFVPAAQWLGQVKFFVGDLLVVCGKKYGFMKDCSPYILDFFVFLKFYGNSLKVAEFFIQQLIHYFIRHFEFFQNF